MLISILESFRHNYFTLLLFDYWYYADIEVYPVSIRLFLRTSKILMRLDVLFLLRFSSWKSYYVLILHDTFLLLNGEKLLALILYCITPQNGRAQFKNLAANAAKFLNYTCLNCLNFLNCTVPFLHVTL